MTGSRPTILLVGQAPSRDKTGRSANRLRNLIGVSEKQFWERFEWKNLLKRHYGKAGKGDAFPMDKAVDAAVKMKLHRTNIFLGRNVAAAFGDSDHPYMTWWDVTWRVEAPVLAAYGMPSEGGHNGWWVNQVSYCIFPHPSGISRWWNDPANVKQARDFLRELYGE